MLAPTDARTLARSAAARRRGGPRACRSARDACRSGTVSAVTRACNAIFLMSMAWLRASHLGAAAVAVCVCVPFALLYGSARLPTQLEPTPGASQCGYELLRAFAHYVAVRLPGLRYTLGAGTLLGAVRNSPAGLLQWEHDVDVYLPAKDAVRLHDAVRHDCATGISTGALPRCRTSMLAPAPCPTHRWTCSGCAGIYSSAAPQARAPPAVASVFKLSPRQAPLRARCARARRDRCAVWPWRAALVATLGAVVRVARPPLLGLLAATPVRQSLARTEWSTARRWAGSSIGPRWASGLDVRVRDPRGHLPKGATAVACAHPFA